MDGFSIFRGDRKGEGCKTRGGGVCLYVNHRWANPNNSHIKLTACSPNLEILTVNIRPFYLPREFSNIVYNVVYIPPNANDSDVTEQLVNIVQEQEDRWPDAAAYVLGDLNHVTLRDHLPHVSQHVTVPTRKEKTIDLCYCNTPDSYKSYQLPCLGDSDHNMVHICPKYRPTLKTESTKTKTVQKWNADTEDTLKACFEST
ncbi:endonuclease domain of the non-LTR retrotransposon LINE-1, partial [Elysia marginata]